MIKKTNAPLPSSKHLELLHDRGLDSLNHVALLQTIWTIDTKLLHQLAQLLHTHFIEIDVRVELARFFQGADGIVLLSETLAGELCWSPRLQVFADLSLDAFNVVAHFVEWTDIVGCAPLGDAILDFLFVIPFVLADRIVHTLVEFDAHSRITFRLCGDGRD